MFRKTLLKLTAINSLVFLLIFVAFTSTLYGYLKFRLFDKIDETMWSQADSFQLINGRVVPKGRPLFDPRIFILIRSTDGHIVNPIPFHSENIGRIEEIASMVNTGEIHTKEYEGHMYRVISVPYQYPDNVFNADSNFFLVQTVIAVSVVDPEVALLNRFLWIILFGGIIGMLGIILAGYFLAKHAMIPIQASWEKQQQFVSDASHELRSPVTGIYNNAELMLRHPEKTIEEQSYRINTIIKESMRMTKLIASLLTLARTDATKAELQLKVVNISKMIELVVNSFRPMEEVNGIRLTVNMKPDLKLLSDKERLHQLLVILLDNAFKYTPSGGQIQVACLQLEKNLVLTVQDTGLGIAPAHLPYIFDRFFRGDKARSRKSGGTGLGLAIAKWIVEQHKGKITVESILGKGTKFTVSIPIKNTQKS